MKILGSTVLMANRHSLDKVSVTQESLRVWTDARPARDPSPASVRSEQPQGDQLVISQKALEAYKCASPDNMAVTVDPEIFGLSPADRILILILEKVLGIKIKIPDEIERAVKNSDGLSPSETLRELQAEIERMSAARARAGWGMEYERRETFAESETLSFSVQGIVNTADGKQIAIEVELNLHREFLMQSSFAFRAGDARAVDPLIINYDGPAADFTTTTFRFDIDSDGSPEEIASLGPGSGFLALDRNGDGIVNNGSELFGPSTGDGFAELKALDDDGNDWIDAGDPVFERLRIWSRDQDGNSTLVALGQRGIGAIYLGNIAAPFNVKDASNELQAQNTRMGVYLTESGRPGIVQQVDLAVKGEK